MCRSHSRSFRDARTRPLTPLLPLRVLSQLTEGAALIAKPTFDILLTAAGSPKESLREPALHIMQTLVPALGTGMLSDPPLADASKASNPFVRASVLALHEHVLGTALGSDEAHAVAVSRGTVNMISDTAQNLANDRHPAVRQQAMQVLMMLASAGETVSVGQLRSTQVAAIEQASAAAAAAASASSGTPQFLAMSHTSRAPSGELMQAALSAGGSGHAHHPPGFTHARTQSSPALARQASQQRQQQQPQQDGIELYHSPDWQPGVLGFGDIACTEPACRPGLAGSALETKLREAQALLTATAADWQKRVKAMAAVRSVIARAALDGASSAAAEAVLSEARSLADRLAIQAGDLRSSVVKLACVAAAELAVVVGSKGEGAAQVLLPRLIRGVVVTKEIMAMSCHNAIITVLYNAGPGFARVIPKLISGVASKHRELRRRCTEYLAWVLGMWSRFVLGKHEGTLASALTAALTDADAEVRSLARQAWHCFYELFPESGMGLLASLDAATKRTVETGLHGGTLASLPAASEVQLWPGARVASKSGPRAALSGSPQASSPPVAPSVMPAEAAGARSDRPATAHRHATPRAAAAHRAVVSPRPATASAATNSLAMTMPASSTSHSLVRSSSSASSPSSGAPDTVQDIVAGNAKHLARIAECAAAYGLAGAGLSNLPAMAWAQVVQSLVRHAQSSEPARAAAAGKLIAECILDGAWQLAVAEAQRNRVAAALLNLPSHVLSPALAATAVQDVSTQLVVLHMAAATAQAQMSPTRALELLQHVAASADVVSEVEPQVWADLLDGMYYAAAPASILHSVRRLVAAADTELAAEVDALLAGQNEDMAAALQIVAAPPSTPASSGSGHPAAPVAPAQASPEQSTPEVPLVYPPAVPEQGSLVLPPAVPPSTTSTTFSTGSSAAATASTPTVRQPVHSPERSLEAACAELRAAPALSGDGCELVQLELLGQAAAEDSATANIPAATDAALYMLQLATEQYRAPSARAVIAAALAVLRRCARYQGDRCGPQGNEIVAHVLTAFPVCHVLGEDSAHIAQRTLHEICTALIAVNARGVLTALVEGCAMYERNTGGPSQDAPGQLQDSPAIVQRTVAALRALRHVAVCARGTLRGDRGFLAQAIAMPRFPPAAANMFLSTTAEVRKYLTQALAEISVTIGAHPIGAGVHAQCDYLHDLLAPVLSDSQLTLVSIYTGRAMSGS